MMDQLRLGLINTIKLATQKQPEILTVLGVGGVLGTAWSAAKAGAEAEKILQRDYRLMDFEAVAKLHEETTKDRLVRQTKLVWKCYIPTFGWVVLTGGSILALQHVTQKRLGAATTAYALSEKAFSAYKEKVIETIGENKEQKIRDSVAQDEVRANTSLVIVSSGESLCFEAYTGRYFMSSMEDLRKALNTTNAMIISDLYVTLDEFYHLVGLPSTDISSGLGWNSDRLLDLEFSSALSPDGKPCISFAYNYVKPV